MDLGCFLNPSLLYIQLWYIYIYIHIIYIYIIYIYISYIYIIYIYHIYIIYISFIYNTYYIYIHYWYIYIIVCLHMFFPGHQQLVGAFKHTSDFFPRENDLRWLRWAILSIIPAERSLTPQTQPEGYSSCVYSEESRSFSPAIIFIDIYILIDIIYILYIILHVSPVYHKNSSKRLLRLPGTRLPGPDERPLVVRGLDGQVEISKLLKKGWEKSLISSDFTVWFFWLEIWIVLKIVLIDFCWITIYLSWLLPTDWLGKLLRLLIDFYW